MAKAIIMQKTRTHRDIELLEFYKCIVMKAGLAIPDSEQSVTDVINHIELTEQPDYMKLLHELAEVAMKSNVEFQNHLNNATMNKGNNQ
jgi:hypothetical protein